MPNIYVKVVLFDSRHSNAHTEPEKQTHRS